MKRRYGGDPRFNRALDRIHTLSKELVEEIAIERDLISCYGQNLDRLNSLLRKIPTEQIGEKYAEFKAELVSTSMAFFSSLSEQLTQHIKKASLKLRGLPSEIKTSLLNWMRDLWIEKIYPTLQSFVDKIDKVAKLLKVDSYSVELNLAFISVGFTFNLLLTKSESEIRAVVALQQEQCHPSFRMDFHKSVQTMYEGIKITKQTFRTYQKRFWK